MENNAAYLCVFSYNINIVSGTFLRVILCTQFWCQNYHFYVLTNIWDIAKVQFILWKQFRTNIKENGRVFAKTIKTSPLMKSLDNAA